MSLSETLLKLAARTVRKPVVVHDPSATVSADAKDPDLQALCAAVLSVETRAAAIVLFGPGMSSPMTLAAAGAADEFERIERLARASARLFRAFTSSEPPLAPGQLTRVPFSDATRSATASTADAASAPSLVVAPVTELNAEGQTFFCVWGREGIETLAEGVPLGVIVGALTAVFSARRASRVIARHDETQRLRESLSRLEMAILHSHSGFAIVSPDDRLLFTSRAFDRIFGYSRDMHRERGSWVDLFAPECRELIETECRPRAQGAGLWFGQLTADDGEGRRTPVEVSLSGLYDDEGDPDGLILECRDISERLRLEEELRHAQKMEGIGALAGGVAHDFNNLLTGILGFTELLKANADPASPDREYLEIVEQSARQAAELTHKLLAFGRRARLRLSPMDVNRTIAGAITTVQRVLPKSVTIDADLWPEELWAEVDPAGLEQVIMILCQNAAEAMDGAGVVALRTQPLSPADAQMARMFPTAPRGEGLLITVEDHGRGVPEPIRERIFDPFFSTKEGGRGAGLGLAAAYGIVKTHRGAIHLESQVGAGTTVFVYLPACAPLQAPAEAGAPPTPPVGVRPQRGGTVLVVDDEQVVRALTSEILKARGFQALVCENGREALELYQRRMGEIDVVMTDFSMPGMNGRQLAAAIAALNSHARVILTSGYESEGPGNGAEPVLANDSPVIRAFLPKPFAADELIETIHRVLDEPA